MVLEQCNLILIIFSITCLAFHGTDLWPRGLWVHVQEWALSHHVASLATSEAGVQHSRGTGTIHHHGITRMGGMGHGGRGRSAGQWLGQAWAWGGAKQFGGGRWQLGCTGFCWAM